MVKTSEAYFQIVYTRIEENQNNMNLLETCATF